MECSLILANMVTSTQRYVSALVCMCMCTLHEFVVCGCAVAEKKTYNFTITVRVVTVIRYMKKNDIKESEPYNALISYIFPVLVNHSILLQAMLARAIAKSQSLNYTPNVFD